MQDLINTASQGLDSAPNWELNQKTLSEWAAVWSPMMDITVLHPRSEQGTNFVRERMHGPLAGVRYATGYQMIRHARRKLSALAGVVAVQKVVAGYTAMEFELKNFVHRPGFVVITDHLNTFRGSYHRTIGETVYIPRHLLGLSEHSPVHPIMIPTDSMPGALLDSEIDRYFETAPSAGDAVSFNPDTLLHTVGSIISLNRHPASERAGWWQARNDLIRKYIEAHLGDQNLLPAQICNLFNLSRATLYRMFEADGGVRRYIQDRRLHSAIWDLADGGVRRGRLTRVSERWGFSSNANFNRAVKIAFGMPPGALFHTDSFVAPARFEGQQADYPLYDWLTQLSQQDSASRLTA